MQLFLCSCLPLSTSAACCLSDAHLVYTQTQELRALSLHTLIHRSDAISHTNSRCPLPEMTVIAMKMLPCNGGALLDSNGSIFAFSLSEGNLAVHALNLSLKVAFFTPCWSSAGDKSDLPLHLWHSSLTLWVRCDGCVRHRWLCAPSHGVQGQTRGVSSFEHVQRRFSAVFVFRRSSGATPSTS